MIIKTILQYECSKPEEIAYFLLNYLQLGSSRLFNDIVPICHGRIPNIMKDLRLKS